MFTEVVQGSLYKRGRIVPIMDLPSIIADAQSKKDILFESYYRYDEDILEYRKTHPTTKGYQGTRYLDRIILDIDRKDGTLDETMEIARRLAKRLNEEFSIPQQHIFPYFSGNGFHIAIPEYFGFTPSPELPFIVKTTLKKWFPEADSIYDANRIIRVENSINDKSGLYKIPLAHHQLENISAEALVLLAQNPQEGFTIPTVTPTLSHLIVERELKTEVLDNPSRHVTCTQKMFKEGPEKGERHNKILRMASAFRRAGVPESGIVTMLCDWESRPEVERLVHDVFHRGYRYSCQDRLMAEYCDPKCFFFKNKDYSMKVMSSKDMEKELIAYSRADFSKTGFDMREFYSTVDEYRILPGELAIVLGDTGVNKTAWVQNLCVKLRRMRILFLSLEVSSYLLYRRFIQISRGMTKRQVEDHYKVNNNELSSDIDHIHVVTTSPIITDIERLVKEVNPNILVVDTTDGIRVPGIKDPNIASGEIGIRLKDVAQQLGIIVIGIHHVSKGAMKGPRGEHKDLDVHAGKGSSSVEQKADKVIAIEGDRDSTLRKVRSMKARDEGRFSIYLDLDYTTFRMPSLIDKRRELYGK